jgi:hypothetical protein
MSSAQLYDVISRIDVKSPKVPFPVTRPISCHRWVGRSGTWDVKHVSGVKSLCYNSFAFLCCPFEDMAIHSDCFVRLSVCHENYFLTFLHRTCKLYCLWQHGHDDAMFFRSGSQLMKLCPFLYLDFLFWQFTRGRHKCSSEQPSSFLTYQLHPRATQVFNWTTL